jgi:hypothetical protein
MRLTIIADDGCICVDGVCYLGINMPELGPLIHAVQWYGEYGEIEYKSVFNSGVVTRAPNTYIDNINNFEWALGLFEAAKIAQETANAEIAAAEDQPTSFGTQTL